jgi:hypothetical protein
MYSWLMELGEPLMIHQSTLSDLQFERTIRLSVKISELLHSDETSGAPPDKVL